RRRDRAYRGLVSSLSMMRVVWSGDVGEMLMLFLSRRRCRSGRGLAAEGGHGLNQRRVARGEGYQYIGAVGGDASDEADAGRIKLLLDVAFEVGIGRVEAVMERLQGRVGRRGEISYPGPIVSDGERVLLEVGVTHLGLGQHDDPGPCRVRAAVRDPARAPRAFPIYPAGLD